MYGGLSGDVGAGRLVIVLYGEAFQECYHYPFALVYLVYYLLLVRKLEAVRTENLRKVEISAQREVSFLAAVDSTPAPEAR